MFDNGIGNVVAVQRRQIVDVLARSPLMLSILKVISNSEKGETPSSVALKLSKLTPNVARMAIRLMRMGILESERAGKNKIYRVPENRRTQVRAIIQQAAAYGVSDGLSRLTESFYQNLLYSSLRNILPDGWRVATNVRLKTADSMINLDLCISADNGTVAGVELNMGPPGQHLYSLIGRTLTGMSGRTLPLLILVLLATHVANYDFLKRIRAVNSQPRYGVILREMPLGSESKFAEDLAKDIINTIKDSR